MYVTPPDRYQILSLDGGGIKGLFAAAILAQLEEDLATTVADHFDLIVGTSAGGIIALGLGAGRRPREMVEFFARDGQSIFGNPLGWRTLRRYWKRKYSHEALKAALQRYLGDRRLADSKKALVVPSYNLDRDDVYLFKTPHHPRLVRDGKQPMWRVGLATSAAPTYFPACCEVDHIRLIDGGIWANNPAMVGVVEAVSMFNIPLDAISVLSISTTTPAIERGASLSGGGLWQWKSAAIDVALRGQSRGVQAQVQHLIGLERAIRLDAVVADRVFDITSCPRSGCSAKPPAQAVHSPQHSPPNSRSTLLQNFGRCCRKTVIPIHRTWQPASVSKLPPQNNTRRRLANVYDQHGPVA